MRKLVNATFASLDGVIERMEAWHFGYIDAEANRIATDQLLHSDAMLMGRRTYELYAGEWPGREDGGYVDKLNTMPKYVASRTLTAPTWPNTTVICEDLVGAVKELKDQPGGDILMHGLGPVAQTLLDHGLLDELHLWVHPVLAGVGDIGDLLFNPGTSATLTLSDVRRLESGVVILSYATSDW